MAPGSDALSQDAGPPYGRRLALVPANKFSADWPHPTPMHMSYR